MNGDIDKSINQNDYYQTKKRNIYFIETMNFRKSKLSKSHILDSLYLNYRKTTYLLLPS